MRIKDIKALQIISSRGHPTIKTTVTLSDGSKGSSSVPSGASKGKNEALELIDKDDKYYRGLSVLTAISNIKDKLKNNLIHDDFSTFYEIDEKMIKLDGTKQKTKLGANAILSISIATIKAIAMNKSLEIYEVINNDLNRIILPVPMLNIINGGMHANNNIDFQEFMILPVNSLTFSHAVEMACNIYMSLKGILEKNDMLQGVGDEGGYAPNLNNNEEALDLIVQAIREAGYVEGKDVLISLDVAASSWKDKKSDRYVFPKSKSIMTTEELIDYYEKLIHKYPIFSIEDGLDEEDYEGWELLNRRLGDHLILVGDDLYVTNKELLKIGIEKKLSNAILIKPNQIGTIKETLETIDLADKNNFLYIISHRSGDTCDSFIADLSVASRAMLIKSGAPCRSERVEKYNRLLEIEDEQRCEYSGHKIKEMFANFSYFLA